MPVASITGALIVNGGEFDDTLTLDFAGGNPIPVGGLTFSGGTGDNALRLLGSGGENPVYSPDALVFGDGQIAVGGRIVNFSGLEPVDFDNVGIFTLVLPAADDVVDLAGGLLTDGRSEASVISGASGGVAFAEARVSDSAIVIDATQVDGDESVMISGADNAHGNVGLTIMTGSGNDIVSVNGTAKFAGPVSISSPSIILNANLSTTYGSSAGDLSLTGSVVVGAPVVLNTNRLAGAGDVLVDGSLLLNESLAITAGTGDVSFLGTVDGQHALTIDSQGSTLFSSAVGSATPLASLAVDSGGTTSVTNVTTNGIQNYGNDLLVSGVLSTTNETVSVAGVTTVTGPTTINVGSGLVSFNGGLNLTASTELVANQIVLGSHLGFVINGPTIDTHYPQLKVSSPVELNDVDLVISGTYQPTVSDSFNLVSNESPAPFVGTFNGKTQWAPVTINGGTHQKELTYVGGDGNDIVLIRANTAPVALDDEVDTDEVTTLLINVLADNGNGADSDDENNLDPTLTVNLSSPYRGALVNHSDGTFTFNPNGEFEFLAVGESTTESFTYRIEDARGETANGEVTITITGTNDEPTITLKTGDNASTGLDENQSGLTATGTLTVGDSDLTDTVATAVDSMALSGTGVGNIPASLTAAMLKGFMTVDSGNVIGNTATTGKINWSFDSDSEAFNFLAMGETLLLTYTISATDSQNASVTRDVVITITGINDEPTITLPTGSSNNILVRKNGDNVEVIDQNTANILSSTALVNTRSLKIIGSETDADSITLDYSLAAGGFFTLPEGIDVSGGSGSGDTLTVTGTGATQAVYSTVVSPAGPTQLTISEASLNNIISYSDYEDLTFDGMLSFAATSTLSVGGGSLTIGSAEPVDLGSLTLIGGGTLTSSSAIILNAGEELIGSGLVAAVVSAEFGSSIQATGGLTLGDASSVLGFSTLGQLKTNTHTVTLLDADQAVLGAATTLGSSGVAGALLAANGLYLSTGNTIDGYGSVDTPNLSSAPLTINGSVEGESQANSITLNGFINGTGSLNNVLANGTYSPGFSPVAVTVGSVCYGNDSIILLEIGGTSPGSSGHDQINHAGKATLDGTLDVQLINGFTPSVGDSFVILTSAGGITGTFATQQFPTAPLGSGWTVVYSANEVRVELVDLANVDTVQFGDGTAQHSRIDQIVVKFEGQVDIDVGAFAMLKHGSSGGAVVNSFTPSQDINGNTLATITFSGAFTRDGGALLDGYYQLTIDGSKVRRKDTLLTLDGDGDGQQGGNLTRGEQETDDFFALYGDTNGDGLVGIAEFGQFRAAFGKTPAQAGYTPLFDYDGQGVGISDFGQFRARFGKPKLPFE